MRWQRAVVVAWAATALLGRAALALDGSECTAGGQCSRDGASAPAATGVAPPPPRTLTARQCSALVSAIIPRCDVPRLQVALEAAGGVADCPGVQHTRFPFIPPLHLALMHARSKGALECVQLLLDAGADPRFSGPRTSPALPTSLSPVLGPFVCRLSARVRRYHAWARVVCGTGLLRYGQPRALRPLPAVRHSRHTRARSSRLSRRRAG